MCGLAAFIATMDFLEQHAVIEHLWSYGAALTDAINTAAKQAGIAKHFFAGGPAVSPYLRDRITAGGCSLVRTKDPVRTGNDQTGCLDALVSNQLQAW